MLIEVDLSAAGAQPHEKEIILTGRASFLLPATLAAVCKGAGERTERLVYSGEGLIPVKSFDPDRSVSLNDIFQILESYIRNLLSARDLLFDERLLSSDPEKGVFVRSREIRSVWGTAPREEAHEKICRVAGSLAAKERVMGAGSAMQQVCGVLADGSRGLGECLKAVEVCHREWNYIV